LRNAIYFAFMAPPFPDGGQTTTLARARAGRDGALGDWIQHATTVRHCGMRHRTYREKCSFVRVQVWLGNCRSWVRPNGPTPHDTVPRGGHIREATERKRDQSTSHTISDLRDSPRRQLCNWESSLVVIWRENFMQDIPMWIARETYFNGGFCRLFSIDIFIFDV
jgi:hypothetical protein